ncbi:MAG: pentapeptide repeat-containing protein [Cyanobacteria bacterium P01_A01_bin.83]
MAWEITVDELRARYAAGERNFAGVDLNPSCSGDWIKLNQWDWVNKKILDLRGINLRGANLFRVELSRCNLAGADFFGASLMMGGLAFSDLRNANLRGASLHDCVLRGADLTGADLSYANLTNAVLLDADLTGTLVEWTIFIGTNLTGIKGGSCYGDAALIWNTTMWDGTIEPGPYVHNR